MTQAGMVLRIICGGRVSRSSVLLLRRRIVGVFFKSASNGTPQMEVMTYSNQDESQDCPVDDHSSQWAIWVDRGPGGQIKEDSPK
ncbi:MAG: hypothetical protein L0332_10340 [Chloroflexi bacterium]|nr:hypothetical protein [Chloroflexota bacterium]MCI0576065.1 hypothetical protein [Chloroflexota bacterium]MCI0647853.1 hypothetical protein [Chloroflexota bacterium]MCI0727104.1 hypothetical protein [Chloroflexota bacterium]